MAACVTTACATISCFNRLQQVFLQLLPGLTSRTTCHDCCPQLTAEAQAPVLPTALAAQSTSVNTDTSIR